MTENVSAPALPNSVNGSAPALPSSDDKEAWRAQFIGYYTTNCPSKVKVVTDSFLDKWAGKYDQLWAGVTKKYGPPGEPIVPKPRRRGPPGGGRGRARGPKKTVADCHDEFVELVKQQAPEVTGDRAGTNLVDAKQSSAANGLETATFTVCARIRPVLAREEGIGGDGFRVVFPGPRRAPGGEEKLHTEAAVLLNPKISFKNEPQLTPAVFTLDYVFSTESEQEIYDTVGAPLVARALDGRTGVIFAYGQTGSGKTHTMNHLMDRVAVQLCADASRPVRFSYLEILGNQLTDTLAAADGAGVEVKMGEVEGGAIELKNLSEHAIAGADDLLALIDRAKAKRCVAATEMNDASSRSHGVALFTVGHGGGGAAGAADGKLYVIDLAGSESAKDLQKHDRARMDETKKINVSLNALKECIQARTLASSPGSAHNTHIPYRRSKLTLLLKDIFDIHCPRLTATVVLATANPLAKDAGQTNTTLGYAAPLREAVGMFGMNRKRRNKKKKKKKPSQDGGGAAPPATEAPPPVVLEVDVRDPALWSASQLATWLRNELELPEEVTAALAGRTGLQLCALPEPELFAAVGDPAHADKVRTALWALIVAAKLVKRRPDGRILSDEAEAAELAAKQAAADARMEAQAARAAAAVKADLAARGIEE